MNATTADPVVYDDTPNLIAARDHYLRRTLELEQEIDRLRLRNDHLRHLLAEYRLAEELRLHLHIEFVAGCYRCDLSRDEVQDT